MEDLSMEKFPAMNAGQVALLRVEKSTGILLDVNFARDISPEQERYTVFESFDEAFAYVNNMLKQREDTEFVIYDRVGVLVDHINAA